MTFEVSSVLKEVCETSMLDTHVEQVQPIVEKPLFEGDFEELPSLKVTFIEDCLHFKHDEKGQFYESMYGL